MINFTNKCKNTSDYTFFCLILFQNLDRAPGAPKGRVDVPRYMLDYLYENLDDKTSFTFPWAEECVTAKNIFWERLLCIKEGRSGWLSCTICNANNLFNKPLIVS